MTITTVKECQRKPLARREDGSIHGTRTYEIVSDDDTTSLADIEAHGSVPDRLTAHPDHAGALLREYSVEFIDGFHDRYILSCRYDSQLEAEDEEDPLNALIRAGFRAQDREVPAFFDAFGHPNVNTAGDLIPGLIRLENEYVAPVTANFASVPLWIFELNNSLNRDPVTFREIEFAPGTLLIKNMEMPDSPEQGSDGTEYWPITFDIVHNPDGHYELHPNKGTNELSYQTRSTSTAAWVDSTFAAYDAKTPTSDRRIIKRRIRDANGQDVAEPQWLDANGRADLNPTLITAALSATGAMTAGSTTLTMSSAEFDDTTTGADNGKIVVVLGAGPHGRDLRTRIASTTSTTVVELEDGAAKTVSGKSVYMPGVLTVRVINQPLKDWSPVLLPNNDPE